MNYLKNIVRFESFAELNEISDKSYRLWHVLMAIDNSCAWSHWFRVPLKVLKSRLNTESKTTIYNARNQLVQLDLLEVRPGKTGQAAQYHLIPLVHDDGTNQYQVSVPNSVPNSDHSHVPNHGPSSVPNSVPLNKQSKTKQNNNKKKKEKNPAKPDAHLEDRKKIVAYLNQRVGAHFKPNASANRRPIDARLNEGYKVPDFKKAIDNKVADWANDTKMAKYLRPSTLFGPKMDGYINELQRVGPTNDKFEQEQFSKDELPF